MKTWDLTGKYLLGMIYLGLLKSVRFVLAARLT